jgi:serine/threonine protein kinase
MIAVKRECLNPSEVRQVVSGACPPEDFDSAISHLDDCERCRAAVDALDRGGHWIHDSLAADQPDPLQAETACQVALWRMLDTPTMTVMPVDTGTLPKETLGPYRLLRQLGSGGMGTVYLAQHERLRRQCAIKLLPRERVDQPGWLERFDREMTTVASLEHPNVVRATDAGHEDGWHYLVMEHLDGLDVGRIGGRMGELEVADAGEIVRQAALGLAHVHASGLVHRDIKPSNLMLTRDGVVKLLDLGLVLSGDDPLAVDDRLTTVGHLMGTMPYMAPEQLIDSRDVDSRADIYALGATLYRLIAGRPPHPRRGGLAKHVLAITSEDPPTLDTVRPDVDPEVVALVAEMLSRDPGDRPQNADQVAERLASMRGRSALKRLLRQTLRKHSDDERSSTLQPRVSAAQPPRRPINRWFLLAGFAASFFLFGLLIKIATDRGELIIKSDQQDLVIAVKSGEEVVERLQITAGEDERVTLHKGTYVVQIEGVTDGLSLDQNVITIGRGDSVPIRVEHAASDRHNDDAPMAAVSDATPEGAPQTALLYQGKDLGTWRDLLTREQDPRTLGQVMRAVEMLTRGTENRVDVAKETLRTARKWGGIVSAGLSANQFGGDEDPSQVYMAFLLDVFPNYFPEAGLRAVNDELAEGNDRSRIAAIWLLNNYLIPSTGFTYTPPNLEGRWQRELRLRTDNGQRLLASVDNNVVYAVEQFSPNLPNSNYVENLAVSVATSLRLITQQPIGDGTWLRKAIFGKFEQAESVWRERQSGEVSGMGGFGVTTPWVVREALLAVVLQSGHDYEFPWDYVASVLLDSSYQRHCVHTDEVFDAVVENAPGELLKGIESQLQSMVIPIVDESHATGGFGASGLGGGGFGGGVWLPVYNLGVETSIWPKALKFYAQKTQDPQASLELLKSLRELMKMNGFKVVSPQQTYKAVDSSIETLGAAIQQQDRPLRR